MDIDLVDDESIDGLLRASAAFGQLDADALDLVRNALEARVVRSGEVLMRQGDAADGLYLVGSGRLKVVIEREEGSEDVINEVGRGELVGEMALLTDSPRSATIIAVRDSHVLFLSSSAFARVVQARPQALRVISSALISKLMYTIRHGSTTTPATSIVIVPLDESEPVRELGDRLARSLEPLVGLVPVVRADDMPAEVRDSSQLRRAAWREHLERRTARCCTSPNRRSARGPTNAWRTRISSCWPRRPGARTGCAPWRKSWAGAAVRQAAFGAGAVTRAHHDQPPRDETLARGSSRGSPPSRSRRPRRRLRPGREVARRPGVGVVFSGGGARGIAHVGVLRALLERGVTIDATAGASIGAIVAGAVARGDGPDDVSRRSGPPSWIGRRST